MLGSMRSSMLAPVTVPFRGVRRYGGGLHPGATHGPELQGTPYGSWTLGTGITGDGTGLTFAAVANNINTRVTMALEDDVTYKVEVDVSNYTEGALQIHLYGATAVHHGQGANITANGTFIQEIVTTGASSIVNQIRLIASGTATSLKVTRVSVKKKLT